MTVQSSMAAQGNDAESVSRQRPTELLWSENFLFTLYDDQYNVGMWLHIGSVPTAWHLWEDRVYLTLPDGGVLSMMAYHARSDQADQLGPAGSVMKFICLEPFTRWHISFDGFAWYTSEQAMRAGGEPRYRRRLKIDMNVACTSPAWHGHTSTGSEGQQGMSGQSWAKEHYEQLTAADGNLIVDDHEYKLSCTGWRDHSRGPRGRKSQDAWGGHVIGGCQFPGGRQLLFSRYWRPDGVVSMTGGMLVDEQGAKHSVVVHDAPVLTELSLRGEELPIRISWDYGEATLSMETRASIWVPRERKHIVGRDHHSSLNDMYVLNWGPISWGKETAYAYLERSAHLNALPKSIK